MKLKETVFRRPHHIAAKIVAVLLAVVFWLYVMRVAAPTYDTTYRGVDVQLSGGETLTVTAVLSETTLDVRVFGTKEQLATHSAEDVIAVVNLDELSAEGQLEAEKEYRLPVHFSLPDGMTAGETFVSVRLRAKV